MAAKSTSHPDILSWIDTVIESCKTVYQCKSTLNLIYAYERKLRSTPDIEFDFSVSILDLKTKLNRRFRSIEDGKKISN